MSGRSRRYSAAIAAIARPAPTTRSPRRRQPRGSNRNPSSRILSPCMRSRAATTISNPASRAARAIGSRCDQKYQSSVTRKSSFGRLRPRAAATGRMQLEGLSSEALETASTPGSRTICRRRPSESCSGRCRREESCLIHPRPRRSRKQQNGQSVGAHPGYRRRRLYRPRPVPGARRARPPCRRRAAPSGAGSPDRRRIAAARRYRAGPRLEGCAARPRHRRPSGAARARPAVAEHSGSRT